ncbi:unnamed protein product, partial [Brassica rapa subsp. trilocularis]
ILLLKSPSGRSAVLWTVLRFEFFIPFSLWLANAPLLCLVNLAI